MASIEAHSVSATNCTTVPSDCEMTRASRKPSTARNLGSTFSLKCFRYSGNRAWVVLADQNRTTISGFSLCTAHSGSCFASHDYGPGSNLPVLHQAVAHIGIVFCKGRCGCGVVAAENDERAIRRLRERPGEHQFAPPVRG